jgi:hypothetical protein
MPYFEPLFWMKKTVKYVHSTHFGNLACVIWEFFKTQIVHQLFQMVTMTFVPFLSISHPYLKFINLVHLHFFVVTTLQKVLEDKEIGLTFQFHGQYFQRSIRHLWS